MSNEFKEHLIEIKKSLQDISENVEKSAGFEKKSVTFETLWHEINQDFLVVGKNYEELIETSEKVEEQRKIVVNQNQKLIQKLTDAKNSLAQKDVEIKALEEQQKIVVSQNQQLIQELTDIKNSLDQK